MNLRRTAVCITLLLVPLHAARADVPGCAGPSAGGDWTSYGHDYANTRNQELEEVISADNAGGLTAAWTFAATALGGDGAIDGTPVIADGCLFVGTETGWVFALNADTGELVWKTRLASGVFSSLAVADGKVFANESIVAMPFTVGPRTVALDQATGVQLWETVVSDHPGSDLYASPVVYDGMVITGVGANSIEGDPTFHGSIVFLDADTGDLLHRTWTIPPSLWDRGFSGGGVWGTVAIDTALGYAYTGTGNPFNSAGEYGTTNALIKVDVDRTRPTFGDIVATYKGTPEQYVTSERTACRLNDTVEVGSGFLGTRFWTCEFLDLDFGSSPNLFESDGRVLVGANQKGVYHAADAATMAPAWTAIIGPPIAPTNAVSAALYDGALYVSENPPNWVVAMDVIDGTRRWAAPHTGANDARHYEPTSAANGVVYQLDGNGILHAYAASDGSLLAVKPMSQDVGAAAVSTQSGGVAIARNTVYTAADQYVVAYRP